MDDNQGHDDEGTPVPTLTDVVDSAADAVPMLHDVVDTEASRQADLVALQADLTSLTRELTDRLLHTALQEMESALFERVSDQLRDELPDLIERVLKDHLEKR